MSANYSHSSAKEDRRHNNKIRRDKSEEQTNMNSKTSISFWLIQATLVSLIATSCSANHATSEVWSETDGLNVKYSTNHDDLLSTKGSELSLSTTHNKHQEAQEEPQGGSSGAESSNQESNQDDASSEKAASQEQSSSSPQGEQSKSEQQSSDGASNESNDESSDEDSASQADQGADATRQTDRVALAKQSPKGRKAFQEPASQFKSSTDEHERRQAKTSELGSYNSALDQVEDSQDGSEVANSDESDQPVRESSPLKFNRIAEDHNISNKNSNKDDDETPEGVDEASKESDFGPNSVEADKLASRAKQNMIDFDRLASAKQRSRANAEPQDSFGFGSFGQPEQESARRANQGMRNLSERVKQLVDTESLDEDSNGLSDEQELNGFNQAQSQSNQRTLAAALTPRKSEKPTAQTGPKAGDSSRQLPYFRSLRGESNSDEQLLRKAKSPDNVRDNFISPGHFPGSMAHLTQAASETQRKQLELANAESSKLSTSPSELSPVQESSQASKSASSEPQKSRVDPAVGGQQVQQVTPEPESQPESQQISAPILMSTTTMAPLTVDSSKQPAEVSSSTSTTQAPTLKRFKFRKYR